MIDISNKKEVPRKASAEGEILLKKNTVKAVEEGRIRKGDVYEVSRTAGFLAVKRTSELIPNCHNIALDSVNIDFETGEDRISVKCAVSAVAKTGVEMEALVGVSAALLNIWDMVKYLEKDSEGQYPDTLIHNIRVLEKKKG